MSSVLSGLKIVAASKPHALPVVVRRRHKLISRLNQQRELANAKINGEVYLPKRLRSFIDKATGERYAKEVPVRIKSWWWIGEQGELLLQVKYGSRVIEFGKGKSAIEIQSEHQICDVTLFERVGFVRELLFDGLERARMVADIEDIMAHMTLAKGTIFDISDEECVDVVYLDPMFPHNDKSSAAVKKEMAFFRDLVGHDEDADALLPQAMGLARYRVVVKRPKGAPYLDNQEPSYRLDGKSGRFDVYVKRSLDHGAEPSI